MGWGVGLKRLKETMARLDVNSLVQPIAPDAPSGPDLGYDAAFLELERLAQGTPEVQVGDCLKPAQDPDWRKVGEAALDLQKRTRHLRVAVLLAASRLATEGFPGLADALEVLKRMVEDQWETLYPRLDPDLDNDPMERVNIIADLAAPLATFGDWLKFQERAQTASLAKTKLGPISLRDILISRGEMSAPAPLPGQEPQKPIERSALERAFADTPVADLQATAEAVDRALANLQGLGQAVDARAGAGRGPDLRPLEGVLKAAGKQLQTFLAKQGVGTVPAEEGGGPARPDGAGSAAPGEIRSSADVLLVLERICRYYETNEVSSPVPLLVRCAQQMVSKGFLEITRLLTPEAIRMLEDISTGPKPEEAESS